MYCGADFDPHDGGDSEIETYTLSFVNDVRLQNGEVITAIVGGTWQVDVTSGSDATPSARLNGVASIDPSGMLTSQQFIGLLATVTYRLTAIALTNFGNQIPLWSHAPGAVPN